MPSIQTLSATLLLIVFAGIAIKVFSPIVFQLMVSRYSRSRTKINGAKAARQMLKHHGITNVVVSVYPFEGSSPNCFDKELNALFLSHAIYHGHTVPDIAIACHEAAHAVQNKTNFKGLLPFTFFIEWDANRKAIAWLRSDLASSIGGLNKWADQSQSLLRWSLLTYLF
jgi:Zn-dependent membrane protease YugP